MKTKITVTAGKTVIHRLGDEVVRLQHADATIGSTSKNEADEVNITIVGHRGVADMRRLANSVARAMRNHRTEAAK